MSGKVRAKSKSEKRKFCGFTRRDALRRVRDPWRCLEMPMRKKFADAQERVPPFRSSFESATSPRGRKRGKIVEAASCRLALTISGWKPQLLCAARVQIGRAHV